jgi:hypothetical protein
VHELKGLRRKLTGSLYNEPRASKGTSLHNSGHPHTSLHNPGERELPASEEEMVAATLSTGQSTAELVLGLVGLVTAIAVISSPM